MIGVFGGTFDPVHYGHLRPALELQEALGLSELRLVPSRQPPHRSAPVASQEQRLAMLRLAVADTPGFVVDTREMERPGPSYMVDTLRSLRAELGDAPICLLLGLDAFLGLGTWHEAEEIPRLAHLVVAHRPGFRVEDAQGRGSDLAAVLLRDRRAEAVEQLKAEPAGRVWLAPVTALNISSTAIRRLIAEEHSVRYLLPDPVRRYIEEQRLYRKE